MDREYVEKNYKRLASITDNFGDEHRFYQHPLDNDLVIIEIWDDEKCSDPSVLRLFGYPDTSRKKMLTEIIGQHGKYEVHQDIDGSVLIYCWKEEKIYTFLNGAEKSVEEFKEAIEARKEAEHSLKLNVEYNLRRQEKLDNHLRKKRESKIK